MHVIRQYEFGPPENLIYEEVPDPAAGPGQVRIAVGAAGVHLIDTSIRAGSAGLPFPPPELPMTPGREVAGVVDQVGEGVDPAWAGRRVVAHLGQTSGGYASAAVREVDAVHQVPGNVSDEVAVTMIGTGRTTLGILAAARPRPEDVLLVTAAAGGIGTLLVQHARTHGIPVAGVAGGPEKVALVKEMGADVAVDYREPGWPGLVRQALDGREITLALDGVGGDIGRDAMRLLGVSGRLILFGGSAGGPTKLGVEDLYEKSLTVTMALGPGLFRVPGGLRGLEERALAEAAAGRWVPPTRTFPLKDAAAAHAALESRGTVGKVLLIP